MTARDLSVLSVLQTLNKNCFSIICYKKSFPVPVHTIPCVHLLKVLQKIDFVGQNLGDHEAYFIFQTLLHNKTLILLNLEYNVISNLGAMELSKKILWNSTVKKIQLQNNIISSKHYKDVTKIINFNRSVSTFVTDIKYSNKAVTINSQESIYKTTVLKATLVKGQSERVLFCVFAYGVIIVMEKDVIKFFNRKKIQISGSGIWKTTILFSNGLSHQTCLKKVDSTFYLSKIPIFLKTYNINKKSK